MKNKYALQKNREKKNKYGLHKKSEKKTNRLFIKSYWKQNKIERAANL